MTATSGEEFQVGLAMAGAISAGAYSAGVLDFLIQALDAWETARHDPALADKIPNHRVGIKVIVGASAGSMTGALGAVALAGGLQKVPAKNFPGNMQTILCVLPNLYDAWVVKPEMISSSGGPDFLKTDDLVVGKDAGSALNSEILEVIKDAALRLSKPGARLPYISSTLHVYLTMSNLRGVPYKVSFTGGDFGMMSHGDRAHYCITGLGSWISASPFADTDAVRAIDVKGLFVPNGPSAEWKDYATAAVTSGAFPVGLASRQWQATVGEYQGRKWPVADAAEVNATTGPNWPPAWTGPKQRFEFTAVDGGLINNEPFEYARFTLLKPATTGNPRNGNEADRAVIMIDPFPEPPVFPPDGLPKGDMLSVLAMLIPALRTQAQFKPSEVAVAASGASSRFMIGPHRTLPGATTDERYAIACGLLGGFGGFLARSFREHDFQLGRRNCQKFLLDTFALPDGNNIIKAWPQAALSNSGYRTPPDKNDAQLYHLIPLFGDALPEVPFPAWPQIDDADVDALMKAAEARISRLADVLIVQKGWNWKLRKLLDVAFRLNKGRIFGYVRLSILSDLVRRNQLASWALPAQWNRPTTAQPDDIRAVLAELLNPKFDFRNESGIAAATGLSVGVVSGILASCQAETGKPYSVWRAPWTDLAGSPLYTLVSRKPSMFSRMPGIRQLGNKVTAPSVDPPGI